MRPPRNFESSEVDLADGFLDETLDLKDGEQGVGLAYAKAR